MSSAGRDTSTNCGSVAGLVAKGHDLLNRHELGEAEELFQAALEEAAGIGASSGQHEHTLSSLQVRYYP